MVLHTFYRMEKISTRRCICGMELFFDQKILSQYRNFDDGRTNQKPIEFESGLVHSCPLRDWSHELKCRTCSRAIMFNDRIVGPKGNKIPHESRASGMEPHECMVMKQ